MPRITLPSPEQMNPDQRRVHDAIVSGRRGKIQGPLRAALHNAELAERWSALGELLRYGTTLPPRLSELAILVTGRACQSPFEWYAHRVEGEKAGIEPHVIEAILSQQQPAGHDVFETIGARSSGLEAEVVERTLVGIVGLARQPVVDREVRERFAAS